MKTFLLLFIFSLKSFSNSNIHFSTDYRPGIGRIIIYFEEGDKLAVEKNQNHCWWDNFGAELFCTFEGTLPTLTSLVFMKEDKSSKLFKFTNLSDLRLAISGNEARILVMAPQSNRIIDVLSLKPNFPTDSMELLYNKLEN